MNVFIFPMVKTAAKYAKKKKKKKKKKKICMVDSLDAGFQQVPFVQNFWNSQNIVKEYQSFKISEEKQEKNS